MARGFKDTEGKFHPITQYAGGKKKNQSHRYANDSGLSSMLERSVKDFATKRKNQFKEFKETQNQKFQEEIDMRRRFSGKLIIAFRLAQKQGIKNPKQLEKFIRAQIPDLPEGRDTNRFVEKVLREFVKQERDFSKKIKGKSEAEQKLLKQAFDQSIIDSENRFAEIQKDLDKKFEEQAKKDAKEFEEKQKKLKKEENDRIQAEKKERQAKEELEKKKQSGASESEIKQAEQKVEQTEKIADVEAKEEKDFAMDVLEELEKEKNQMNNEFEVGFPSEII